MNSPIISVQQRPPAAARLRLLASRPVVWWSVVLFLFAHVPFALLEKKVQAFATLHALTALGIGLWWAWNRAQPVKIACVAAYLCGAETIWRAVGAKVFWEYAKYATVLLVLTALFRHGRMKWPKVPTAYLLLLVPGVIVTFLLSSFSDARNNISFNFSGPLALAACTIFFMRVRFTHEELTRVLIAFIAPIVGMVTVIVYGLLTTEVTFGHQSNNAAAGGFGANQVSALLGMGCVAAFLCLFDKKLSWVLKLVFFGLAIEFLVQAAVTFSRAGVYYGLATIAVAGLFLMRNLATAAKLAVVMVIAYYLVERVVLPRVDEYTGGALSTRMQNTHLTGRSEIIEADLQILASNPVFGVGVGRALEERKKFYHGFAAHTEFTRLLCEHGSFGIVAELLLFFMAIRNVVVARGFRARSIAVALVGYSFCFMSGNAMRMVLPSFVFGLSAVTILPENWRPRIRRVKRTTDAARPAVASGQRPVPSHA